jgi:hypothetical protein
MEKEFNNKFHIQNQQTKLTTISNYKEPNLYPRITPTISGTLE